MGLGKTIQAIGALNEIKAQKTLILCPAGLKLNWEKELNIWLKEDLKIYVVAKRSAIIPKNANIIIVNYDIIHHSNIFYQLADYRYDCIICDEAHFMKTGGTERTKAMLKSKGLIRHGKYKWLLTGTPVLNRPIELFPILKVLATDLIKPYDNYVKYSYKFCGAFHDQWGFNNRGASNLDDLNRRLKPFMLRRLKVDVLSELPEKTWQTILLPKLSAVNDFKVDFDKDKINDNQWMGEIGSVRHELALEKLESCFPHIDAALECNRKLVLFAYHRDVIDNLLNKYKRYRPVMVRGGMSAKDKQHAVDIFTHNKYCRLFIGNIQAAGVGINLQVAHHIIFIEQSWVPGEMAQAADRCHRIGQENAVLIQCLVVKDSIEEQMMDTVIQKTRNIRKILE